MKTLKRKYVIKEVEIAGQCDLCKRWLKGKAFGNKQTPYLLEPEFGRLNIQDSIILCTSCFEKKHLGGFENE